MSMSNYLSNKADKRAGTDTLELGVTNWEARPNLSLSKSGVANIKV
jgi:hypothetical protein